MSNCTIQTMSGANPCMKPNCKCCQCWAGMLDKMIGYTDMLMNVTGKIIHRLDADLIKDKKTQTLVESLIENKEMYANANKISVLGKKKSSTGRKICRLKVHKPTTNHKPEPDRQ